MAGHDRPRNRPIRAILMIALGFATAAAGVDGHLDVSGFHPPDGWAPARLPGTDVWAGRGTEAPDGALVVAGHDENHAIFWQAFTADGAASPCTLPHPEGHPASVVDSAFDSAGRLLVAGRVWNTSVSVYQPFVARFLYPDCVPDPEFISNGIHVWGLAVDATAVRVATMWAGVFPFHSERILLAAYDVDGRVQVMRFRDDGSKDSGFGTNGRREITGPLPGELISLRDLAVVDEDRILLVGRVGTCCPGDWDAWATRLLPNGEDDPDWTPSSTLPATWDYVSPGADSICLAVAVAIDGTAYCAGQAETDESDSPFFAVTRLGPAGQIYETVTRPGSGVRWNAEDAELQGDGRLILGGVTNHPDSDLFVTALTTPALDFDPTFGDHGDGDPFTYLDLGIAVNTSGSALLLARDGHPVVFTDFSVAGVREGAVIRLRNRYVFADGFEDGTRSRW